MKTALQIACVKNLITITSEHVGVDYTDPKYPQDKCICTLHYVNSAAGERTAEFEYGTGIGHRVLARGVKSESKYGSDRIRLHHDISNSTVNSYKEAIEKNMLVLKKEKGKVVGPDVADVLDCILSDSTACEQSFEEWCSEFGYDSDSRKAHAVYLASQQNGDKLRKLLGLKLIDELRQKEH
jgi:hypothetical protein